jgi:hypothetical protein
MFAVGLDIYQGGSRNAADGGARPRGFPDIRQVPI